MQTIIIGSFVVDREGGMAPRLQGLVPALRFRWRGRSCEARIDSSGLQIAVIAGRIPSTAEARADRPTAFSILAALTPALPEGWRLRLLPDHRIAMQALAPLARPHTVVELISQLVRFVLALDPYIDQLEAAGTAGPAERAAA